MPMKVSISFFKKPTIILDFFSHDTQGVDDGYHKTFKNMFGDRSIKMAHCKWKMKN
jgi:hypothetical protein